MSVDFDEGSRAIDAGFGGGVRTALVSTALIIAALIEALITNIFAIGMIVGAAIRLQRGEDGRVATGGVFTQTLAALFVHRHMK